MKKLLYINNYNCTNLHKEGYPDNHLWGTDALSRIYKVKCAKVPGFLMMNIRECVATWRTILIAIITIYSVRN